jgi:RNA polymerase sigma-70 factor (ECF subfamily)
VKRFAGSEISVDVGTDDDRRVQLKGADSASTFDVFAAEAGPRLLRVLTAHYGLEMGPDLTADALAWAWEHWDKVGEMENPVGYLYRVGQSSARRHLRWNRRVVLPREELSLDRPLPEPGLDDALGQLSARQRVAVLLVHGLAFSYEEAAQEMGVSIHALRNHVHRGLRRLRREFGEDT